MTTPWHALLPALAAFGSGVAIDTAAHPVGAALLAALAVSCSPSLFLAVWHRRAPAGRGPLAETAAPRGRTSTHRHAGAWRAVKCDLAHRGESGLATVELVVLIPVLLAVIGLAVIGGRITTAEGQVQGAARAAARAASLQRDPTDAQAAADQAAQADLHAAGVSCASYTLHLTAGPPGGVDQVTLSCVVPLGGVEWMNVAASKTVVSSFSSPVDAYREGS